MQLKDTKVFLDVELPEHDIDDNIDVTMIPTGTPGPNGCTMVRVQGTVPNLMAWLRQEHVQDDEIIARYLPAMRIARDLPQIDDAMTAALALTEGIDPDAWDASQPYSAYTEKATFAMQSVFDQGGSEYTITIVRTRIGG